MKRTMIVAMYETEFIDAHIVVSEFTASELESTCMEIQGAYPGCLREFYKTLGFVHLRRVPDVLQFIDLDRELESVCELSEDFLAKIGIII